MRRFFKEQADTFRVGLAVLAPIFLLAYFVYWLIFRVVAVGGLLVANPLLAFMVVVFFIYVFGRILKSEWLNLRLIGYAERLEEKHPRLSVAIQYFIRKEDHGNTFPEVRFELVPETRILGVVTKKWREGDIVWCRVFIPTVPAPFTGHVIEKPEARLTYTGRYIQATSITCISYGMR